MASKKITWETLDHIKEEKSNDWFWIVGIIAVAIAVLAIFFNNILFALLILIASFTSFMMANSTPNFVRYEINRRGVVAGSTVYTYAGLQSYYVIDEDGYYRDRILLKSKNFFMPLIVIPLGGEADPEEVREYLLEYLDEEEMEETGVQKFFDSLGF
jgi:hypothetical protein